jgi:hypothetical protein
VRSPTTILLLRLAVVVATTAISAVAFANGDPLFGVTFAVMAVVNAVLITVFWRRWRDASAGSDAA